MERSFLVSNLDNCLPLHPYPLLTMQYNRAMSFNIESDRIGVFSNIRLVLRNVLVHIRLV